MSRFSKAENYFFFMQSGVNQSIVCIFKEFSVEHLTYPMIYCGLHCVALLQCVGVDIIGNEPKRCRLMFGFPALISVNETSDETIRYQKVQYTFIH